MKNAIYILTLIESTQNYNAHTIIILGFSLLYGINLDQ